MNSFPRLLLIADGFAAGRREMDAEAIRARTVALVEAGVAFVMFRDHAADDATFGAAAEALAADVHAARPDVRLVVNTRLDVALGIGAGVHVGSRGPFVSEAVASGAAFVGTSAHSATQVQRAELAGAAYATLSPIFESTSHPETPPLCVDPLRLAARSARIPVFGLGGISAPRARLVRDAGAHGVAVLSGLLFVWNTPRTVAAFLDALDTP